MLSNSITERTLEILASNPCMDILEAVELAIVAENKFLSEVIESKTERAKQAKKQMCKNVYATFALKEALK